MRFVADHDFHIHSTISPCCHDENQTPEAILNYARENNLTKICLTNHLWDENVRSEAQWHEGQRFGCVSSVLPLPQDSQVSFLFGAEADMDYNFVVGVSEERYDAFDFVVIPTTHMHLAGNTVRTKITTPEEADREREAHRSAEPTAPARKKGKKTEETRATSFDVDDFFTAAMSRGYGETNKK